MVNIYWKVGASGNASTVANWNTALDGSGTDQAPATGDDVIFAQGGNCTWDIDGATAIPNSITLATGYTGTVTQGSVDIAIGEGGLTIQAGTFTGLATQTITIAGNLTKTGGTITPDVARITMTGANASISVNTNVLLHTLNVTGTVEFSSAFLLDATRTLSIGAGAYLTISHAYGIVQWRNYNGGTYANAGTIAGAGYLYNLSYNANTTWTPGAVNCPIRIVCPSTATGSYTITLGANTVLGSSLTIESSHLTNTLTLNLNSKSLSCASLSIGARGVLTGTGTLTANSITVGASGLFTDTNVTYDKTKVVGQTITWTAAEAANASATTSWSLNRAPFHNDNVVFDGTSVNNCLWDIAATTAVPNSITLAAGYTGTVTQGDVDIGIGAGGYAMASGTFTGNDAKNIILENNANLTKTGGTFTIDKAMLVASGGNTITGADIRPRSLTVNGTVTLATSIWVWHTLSIGAGGAVTIGAGATLTLSSYNNANPYSNLGSINGPGTLSLWYYDQDKNFALSNIAAPLSLVLVGSAAASSKHTLPANTVLGSSLSVFSWDVAKTMTLDLAGYNLTARGITVGTRGVLLGGEGVIRNYGNFDSSNGSIDMAGSQYVQASPGTIKLAAGQSLNDLIVRSAAAGSALASNVTVNGIYAHVPDLIQGAYSLTYNKDTEYTGKRRPLRKRIVKRVVWPSLADKELLEDLEAAP